MSQTPEYDTFADIYDIWTTTTPVSARNLPFYVEACCETTGLAVELGVGDGRIAIEVARAGKPITGVDSSTEMLHRCRARAQAAGVLNRLTLIHADFRDFTLPQPGVVVRRQYRRLTFSWLEPEQTRTLLEEAGFEIEALYGDFDRNPFSEDSSEQIWIARRPFDE
jgi:SAM-dependent methyltransferase